MDMTQSVAILEIILHKIVGKKKFCRVDFLHISFLIIVHFLAGGPTETAESAEVDQAVKKVKHTFCCNPNPYYLT
jgi:hypothetical protein